MLTGGLVDSGIAGYDVPGTSLKSGQRLRRQSCADRYI